jgi:hypothetical protein
MTKSAASTEKQEEIDAIQALLQLRCAAVQDDFITELKTRREEMSKKVLGASFAILRSRRRRSRHWKEQCCMSELEDQKIELHKLEKEIEQYENVTRSKTR